MASGQANVWYVDDSGPNGNGTSWGQAFTHLETALAEAANSFADDEIRVAEGLYVPPGPTRTSTFLIPSQTTIVGGWLGSEAPLDPPAGSPSRTILSGDLDGVPSDPSGDCYHEVWVGSEFAVELRRLLIRHGNADGTGNYDRGGGLYLDDSDNVTVSDVTITKCRADYGAGAYSDATCTDLKWRYCTFRNNQADQHGGGYQHEHSLSNQDTVTRIYNCLFDKNTAQDQGGGLWYQGRGYFTVMNCEFRDNEATEGGAVYSGSFGGAGEHVFTNCTIAFNQALGASGSGAGMYLQVFDGIRIENTILWDNTWDSGLQVAVSSLAGPGAVNSATGTLVTYSDIQMSTAPPSAWIGTGNINANPNFQSPTARNLRLTSGSPCVDSGNDFSVRLDFLDLDGDGNSTEQSPLDFTGSRAREIDDTLTTDSGVNDGGTGGDSNSPDSGVVDMGCYESANIIQN